MNERKIYIKNDITGEPVTQFDFVLSKENFVL